MEFTVDQQAQVLKVIEAITHGTDRLPGDYRVMVDDYIEYQRDQLSKSKPRKTIAFNSGVLYWEVFVDDDQVASISKQGSGLDLAYSILSSPQIAVYQVNDILDGQVPTHPASTLQKRLKRAREVLERDGAKLLADYLESSITISNKHNTLTYKPASNIVIKTSTVLDRS